MVEQDQAMKPCLLVFSDDWGRHPSSCQHLVRHLLPEYRVVWVNTIGMRPPRFDRATLRRGLEKLGHWLRPRREKTDQQPENLTVLNPRMWPWFRHFDDRWVNRHLLLRQLRPVVQALPGPTVAITTLPVVADLIDALPVARWVYYCVDDFSQWPGLDQAPLARMEESLARRADVLVAVSEPLQDRLAGWGRAATLLTHGIDLKHWQAGTPATAGQASSGTRGALSIPAERPWIVFWGLRDRRMDVAMVRQLAEDLKQGTILLVGPELDADPALAKMPRVACLPAIPYEQLPALAAEASVLILPYADLPVTRAMQPLKLKEYLATGRPVVARDLPATRAWADAMDLAQTAEEFSAAVRCRLAEGVTPAQTAARTRLAEEAWSAKARHFAALAGEGLPNGN